MSHATGNRLAEYALSEISDELRTVTVLYEDDYEIIYLRDDLQESYDPDLYRRVVDSFRVEMSGERHLEDESSVGSKRATIHYHDNAYVFQFPHDDCHSILLSVVPSVGSQLRSFINACEQRL